MKNIVIVLLWTLVVTCAAVELNSTSLLEGKLQGVEYCETKAKELQYLCSVYQVDRCKCATAMVIAEYLVLTTRLVIHRCCRGKKNCVGAFALISNKPHHADEVFEESASGDIEKPSQMVGSFDLAIMRVKEKIEVVPIVFSPQDINFIETTGLKLAGLTSEGPTEFPLNFNSIQVADYRNSEYVYTFTAAMSDLHDKIESHDFGCAVVQNNNLVGVFVLLHVLRLPSNVEMNTGIKATKINDHMAFINCVKNHFSNPGMKKEGSNTSPDFIPKEGSSQAEFGHREKRFKPSQWNLNSSFF